MSVLRDAGGGALQVYTANELAAAVGMTTSGLTKWLAARQRYRPMFVLEMGHRNVQLWPQYVAAEIRKERES